MNLFTFSMGVHGRKQKVPSWHSLGNADLKTQLAHLYISLTLARVRKKEATW